MTNENVMAAMILGLWVLGVAAIARGVALWSPAGAWIVVGCGLVATAVWPLVRERS